MAHTREERLALNEATFRLANERMASWEERQQGGSPEPYFCECGDLDCREGVRLHRSEYEEIRSDPRHFLVVVGHADPTIETVIHHTQRYDVVQKNEDVRPLVERTDPRST